ncbi:hypothetical protein [Leptothoe kymatousa]|uniref:Uncharacterized protein n=1 Tax=Leptothoe kymatousa TAU-MAC 1615 TaxID=2364775 RepID=A0ABS5Y3P3_9CYAN|nr:hypothetical protein [Leptothoe kymatousa]MBT9312458.1 hypothetical protein [Leptothoe kymatousa TAU-MAC 1615]
MVAAPIKLAELRITWDPLPEDFQLDEKPVENTGQPLLAGALRESLELSGWIRPQMLVASNLGLCATMNENLVIKAPDWLYVAHINQPKSTRKAYTPNLDERQRAERLAEILRSQGIDPDTV